MRVLLSILLISLSMSAWAQVVTRLPTADKAVALTFDACEGKGGPAWFDHSILDYLERERLPFTVFVTGLFAERNRDELARLAQSPLVEIENHSWAHPQHMERLAPERVNSEVQDTARLVQAITGRKPAFFRFPAGNYDDRALNAVESLGYKVVHWSWESGDPVKGLAPDRLKSWVLSRARPGDIMIFHINGRAPSTGKALPEVVAELRRKGYRFVRLDEVVK